MKENTRNKRRRIEEEVFILLSISLLPVLLIIDTIKGGLEEWE